jgi:hypothetical protein
MILIVKAGHNEALSGRGFSSRPAPAAFRGVTWRNFLSCFFFHFGLLHFKVKKDVYHLAAFMAILCSAQGAEKALSPEGATGKVYQGGNVETKVETKKYEGELKANSAFSKKFDTGAAFKTKSAVLPDKKLALPTLRFDEQYPVSSYSAATNMNWRALSQTPIEPKNSPFSSKGTASGFAKNYAVRPYAGREMVRMKQNVAEANKALGGIKDLPDRSLTIDEVRELLNRDSVGKSSRPPLPETPEAKN